MCARFEQDRANVIFKQVTESKALKGRSMDAIAAACLYIACRQEGFPRSFKGAASSRNFHLSVLDVSRIKMLFRITCAKRRLLIVALFLSLPPEICAVSKVSKKDIGRVFKLILRTLETSVDLITTGDFMASCIH